jgi:hypothetical protein
VARRAGGEEAGEAFVEMSVEEVDEEAVWEELESDSETEPTGEPSVTVKDEAVVVPKRSYCERCELFADPPSVHCTNPGTEIVEFVDVEHFRVVSCPVVERRDAGGLGIDLPDED